MNCKPGDLAVVMFVGDTLKYQTNVGRIVRVLRRAEDREYSGYGNQPRWWIRSEGTEMKSSEGLRFEGKMPDIALRPIRPLEEKEDVKREETINA